MRTESAFLRVGNTLYRGRGGTLDFSNHKEELDLLPPDAVTEIVFFEIVEDDPVNPPPSPVLMEGATWGSVAFFKDFPCAER